MRFPTIITFPTNTTKREQALKVLEEASEIHGAYQYDSIEEATLEVCDLLQALANFCKLAGITETDLERAYQKVRQKNTLRGRM